MGVVSTGKASGGVVFVAIVVEVALPVAVAVAVAVAAGVLEGASGCPLPTRGSWARFTLPSASSASRKECVVRKLFSRKLFGEGERNE